MDERDDTALIGMIQGGNTALFGVLYDRYLDRIYRFIYYKTWNKDTAEDITSDVFHKALTRISSFDAHKGNFSQWIYRIARNAVIDHYRTAKRHVPIEDVFDLGEEDHTVHEHDIRISMKHVEGYLRTLTPRQREIITLRIWEEKSYKEIAEIVDGTEDSVKMAFSRTMKELRQKCGPLMPIALIALFTHSELHSSLLS